MSEFMARKDNRGRNLRTGETQREDGRYDYRYIDPRTGKRVAIYSMDLAELREMEKKVQREVDDGLITTSDVKKLDVNTLFENYLSLRKIAQTTRVNYESMWNNHVRYDFGNMKVVQVRPSHVKALYSKMSRQGYSRSTIKIIHDLIYPAFGMAVEDDIIRKNPAKDTLRDYGEDPKEKEALTIEEQEAFFKFVAESSIYNVYLPMLQVMVGTACRIGEIIGLTWDDVNMEDREVSIDHQLVYKDYKDGNGFCFHVHQPKTDAGIRVIPMTETVRKAFLEQRKQLFTLGIPRDVEVDGLKGFIFIGRNGMPMMPSAVNNVLYNIVKAYNKKETETAKKERRKPKLLPKFSAHILRHTGCTRMAERGIDPKVLQYLMGHANIAVTMEVYNHITSKKRIENEIRKMDDLIAV